MKFDYEYTNRQQLDNKKESRSELLGQLIASGQLRYDVNCLEGKFHLRTLGIKKVEEDEHQKENLLYELSVEGCKKISSKFIYQNNKHK